VEWENTAMRKLTLFILRHKVAVIAAWSTVFIVAGIFFLKLEGVLQGSSDIIPNSPSDLVTQTIQRKFGAGKAYTFPVVMTSSVIGVTDPRFPAAVRLLSAALTKDPCVVRQVMHAWNSRVPELLGKDGHSALLLITPNVRTYTQAEMITPKVREAIRHAGLDSAFSVYVTGTAAMYHDMNRFSSDDLVKAESWGIPFTLVVLIFVFGSPIAAGVPLLLAFIAMTIALAGLYFLSMAMPVGIFAQNAVSMIGLGVGVDYALFILSRFRTALQRGSSVTESCMEAMDTAGHSVLFSGITVAVGFAALFLARARFLHTIAFGGIVVVATAVGVALTLLPALLVLMGSAVNWPFRIRTRPAGRTTGTVWEKISFRIMQRPALFTVFALFILGLLMVPALRMKAWNIGCKDLDPSMETCRGFEVLKKNFAQGWMGPVLLLAESGSDGTLWTPQAQDALLSITAKLTKKYDIACEIGFPRLLTELGMFRPLVRSVGDLPAEAQPTAANAVSDDGKSALIILVPKQAPESKDIMKWVADLRRQQWPEAATAGIRLHVGGVSAMVSDFDKEMFDSLWRVIPVVLGLTFLVLMVLFKSLVIPLKATIFNLFSVLASYGFLVLVFQYGIGASVLHLEPPGGLSSFLVLMLFTILFGLSMDYEIFLLARIKEEYSATHDNSRAVAFGLKHTGGLITCAALIMVCLFASFGFTSLTATRELGLGLAFAVLLDATLIRVVLVPALMKLLGPLNWWFPFRQR